MSVEISVIIPTHGRVEALEACLTSVLRQELERSRFEIHVISNFANDQLEAHCGQLRRLGFQIEYACVGQLGANRARNLGLARARGEIVYFVDDDCELTNPQQLQNLVAWHRLWPEVIGVGGPYLTPTHASLCCRLYNRLINTWLLTQVEEIPGEILLLGGNLSLKRHRLPKHVCFDEQIIYGGSEISLQRQMFSLGNTNLVASTLAVSHNFRGDWRSLFKRAWAQGKAKKQHREHHHRRRLRVFLNYIRHHGFDLGSLAFCSSYVAIAQAAWLYALICQRAHLTPISMNLVNLKLGYRNSLLPANKISRSG